jgi:uncharacterized protein
VEKNTDRIPPTVAPRRGTERVYALDVLRGVAVLGILIVNIQSFSMPEAAYANPTVYADLTGVNEWVWLLTHIFADMKFLAIFSMMFGASTLLFFHKDPGVGASLVILHYRRTFGLLIFGLLHAYALWYGDILVSYALCGAVIIWLRHLRPGVLVAIALFALMIPSLMTLISGLTIPNWSPEELRGALAEWEPSEEMLQLEVSAYLSNWTVQNIYRLPEALDMQTSSFLGYMLWRAGGLMLLGMALYKWGILNAQRSPAFYRRLVYIGLLAGIPIVSYGAVQNLNTDFDIEYMLTTGYHFNYWGSLLICFGYIGAVMLACQTISLRRFTRPLAAIGRTALSNYLLQSILCTTIFYGHGFSLFGQVQRSEQIMVVLGIWAFQLLASVLWLRHFQFGPFEWLWRSMTYLRWQPLRKRPDL